MLKLFSRLRRHKAVWYARRGLAILAAILAAAIVTSLNIDIGPLVRPLAERYLADQMMNRPAHIGGLRINVLSGLLLGRVEVDDVTIEGRASADRPFFHAGRLQVSIDWWPAISRRPTITITSIQLTDWQMLVEKWGDGSSFPKFKSSSRRSTGPGRSILSVRDFRGSTGRFTYEDHETPWSVVAPDINLNIGPFPMYGGEVTSTGGTIAIQDFVPMSSDLKIRFMIDGSILHLTQIEIKTDGARTTAAGDLDMAHWPEQSYTVKSRVQFPRMRELFFANEDWPLTGEGDFTGVFHLFNGGHDLKGRFTSRMAGVYDYRFPSLYGSLHWTDTLFDLWDAGSRFSGGDDRFAFSIKPLHSDVRATARFDATYTNIDLAGFTDFQELKGLRFAGRASGTSLMEWPIGRGEERHGTGQIVVTPPAGVEVMTASLAAARAADVNHARHEWGPFAPMPLAAHLPIAGAVTYRFDPAHVYLSDGRFATEHTHVAFDGSTEWAEETQLAFHVTSSDWQESQLVLAGIITDFGSPTGPVSFGGRGEFDGGMTGPFRRPRVEGVFSGEDMRAWDTLWGDGSAHIVVENNYVTVKDGNVGRDGSEIHADGLFSLGYPRDDGGEEMDARFHVVGRDVDSLRHAFQIDDYPVSGQLSGEFHLTGQYQHPFGFGTMTIDHGMAYNEPFEQGTAALRFDGAGVRLDGLTMAKGGGTLAGAAYIGWDSTYSFNVAARRIAMDQVTAFAYPTMRPSGALDFTAAGSGLFDVPRYGGRFHVSDLSLAEESVGQVTGTFELRGNELSGDVDVASPRLAITGTGRIGLTAHANSELTFRFHDSSLDPYVRLFAPRLLPYTTAVATGSFRVAGDLADVDHLLVEGVVDSLDMKLFDYAIHNANPIRLALDQHVVRLDDLELVGEDTRLKIGGTVGLHDERIALQATGEANLGVLQGFFPNVRASGRAELMASVDGPLFEPEFSGSATIVNGRVRHFSLPNSLEAINGTVHFDSRGIRLDDVAATLGEGRVQFGGRIGLEGYLPGDLNVIVRGEDMHVRYPLGVRSTVNADLTVRGNVKAPMVGGVVTVKSALWNQRIDPTASLFDFGGAAAPGTGGAAPAPLPVTLDIEVLVPGTLQVENNLLRLWASADLQIRGPSDHPLIFGRADVDQGEMIFEKRRYRVTKGNIEFTNPVRVDPFFDVEAETRVRVPKQTYRVTVRAAGTMERMQPTFESDPPLPSADVLALLFSDIRRDPNSAEIRALRNPNERETDILTTRATQLLANPISSEVGRVVEQTFGVDTFQLSPSLVGLDENTLSTRVNPSARVTIGKRVSDRAYLTFSRSLSSSINDQILLLEYDQNDRLSWILSRNEDQTYAIEVRVRHVF